MNEETRPPDEQDHPVLSAAVMFVCLWEIVALSTGRLPTISALMWARDPFLRAVLWAGVFIVLTDHFFTRRLV